MAGEIVHIEFPSEDADRAQRVLERAVRVAVRRLGHARHGLPDGAHRRGVRAPRSTRASERDGHAKYYYATDDIDASRAKVGELGGTAGDKMPVPTHGWFAECSDSEGTAFCLWQSDPAAG